MLRIVLFFIIVALGYSQQAHENFYWKEYDDQGYYRIVSHVCARDLNWGTEYDRYCLDVSYVFDWGRNWDYPNVNVVVPEPSTTGMEEVV